MSEFKLDLSCHCEINDESDGIREIEEAILDECFSRAAEEAELGQGESGSEEERTDDASEEEVPFKERDDGTVGLDAATSYELFEHTPKARSTDERRELGRLGERAACAYLEHLGYEIIERNWRCDLGEIDIIAFDEDVLVLVEVKTRSSVKEGLPEDAVTPAKRARYEKLLFAYLQEAGLPGSFEVRFDVIAIMVLGPDRSLLRHHINAFGASEQ